MNDVRTMSNSFSELSADELQELNGGSWNSWKWYDTAVSVAVPIYGLGHAVNEDLKSHYQKGYIDGQKAAR